MKCVTGMCVSVVALMMCTTGAVARPFVAPQERATAARGWQVQTETAVLMRDSGRGLRPTAETLKAALGIAESLEHGAIQGGVFHANGKGWKLLLWDNGNAGSFRRERPESYVGIDRSNGPTREQIVDTALAALTSRFGEVIKLGERERLVTLSVRGEFGGYQANVPGSQRQELLEGWEVNFGRSIDDHLVVGGGSHIRVGFDVKGELESVHFDWPSYRVTSESVLTADPDVVADRVVRQRKNNPQGLRLEAETTECGFVDYGAKRSGRRPVADQITPGCFVKSVLVTKDLAPGNSESSGVLRFVSALDDESSAKVPESVPPLRNAQ